MNASGQPGAREALRVLAIGAHPDDVELCCAGTLARYVQIQPRRKCSSATAASGNGSAGMAG